LICEVCRGIPAPHGPPCPNCGGCGQQSCCDGPVGLPGHIANRPYDAEQDSRDSYTEAIAEIGRRVRAGAPVPQFLLSRKAQPK
jgi:hypothetical protein